MGEGGAVYTNNPLLKRILASLRDWGRDCYCASGKDNTCNHRFNQQHGELPFGYDHKYVYSHFGYNLKVTDMQAAIGCAQLKKLPAFVEARRKNWEYLKEQLSDLEEVFYLPEAAGNSLPSWFGFLLTIKPDVPFKRIDIIQYLEKNNIQTRLLFAGNLIKHPCFDLIRSKENTCYRVVGNLKKTDYITEHTFWIGVYPGMKMEMLQYMVKQIKTFVNNHS
jgi:CDP-6-deoxy-D-xylo-4-hexulose-3-dehydrase